MRYLPRTRSRLAAATVLTLAGGLLAAAAPPAHAGCPLASVWLYENQQGRHYYWGSPGGGQCIYPDSSWHDKADDTEELHTDTTLLPPGTPTGAGFTVWVAIPPN